MTEIKVAKRIIKELKDYSLMLELQVDLLNGEASDSDLKVMNHLLSKRPDRFEKKELNQIVKTAVKLTNYEDIEPEELSMLLNIDKNDILSVTNGVEEFFKKNGGAND